MLTTEIELTILLEDCQTADYMDGKDCPLCRAVKRVVKDNFYVVIGCMGIILIHDRKPEVMEGWETYQRTILYTTYARDFNFLIVRDAKENFTRKVSLPIEMLKQ